MCHTCLLLSSVRKLYITDLRDDALDVPGPGPLAALYEVVRGAMADDEEEEAVGVSVQLVLRQLPLHTVHSLAREVPINLDLESYENLSLNIFLDCEIV